MQTQIITKEHVEKRNYWIKKIASLSGDFGIDAKRLEETMAKEIQNSGIDSLLGHLRLCGAIPERYGHDTSEEKLYSKYTDVVIHEAYLYMGFSSIVLKERADAADVECVGSNYSFVADAKAFRLSRTAKNQKDFKVQAMDKWKYGKPYAMIVCPVYQLPSRQSQIYEQASVRSVCIFTYTHLAVLVRYAELACKDSTIALLHELFKAVEAMNPSKSANAYWQTLNQKILQFDANISSIWQEEKEASVESVGVSKDEALSFLAMERERIMGLSKKQAIKEVLKSNKIENRMMAIKSVTDNDLLEIG